MIWPKDWSVERRVRFAARAELFDGVSLERPDLIQKALGRWFEALAASGRRIHRIAVRADIYRALQAEITAVTYRDPEPGSRITYWGPWGPVDIDKRESTP